MPPTRIVASLSAPAAVQDLVLPPEIGWLQVEVDADPAAAAAALRRRFGGKLICRIAAADGAPLPPERRCRLLRQAADSFDLVALDATRDLTEEALAAVPAPRRLLAYRGPPEPRQRLRRRFDDLAVVPARFYEIVVEGNATGDALAPLRLLHELGRDDVIAYGAGSHGSFSRLLAPYLGSPLTFGSTGLADQPDMLPITTLVDDYGLPTVRKLEHLYGIVGAPVLHSLSPRLHNAAHREQDRPALYLPFHADDFDAFWSDLDAGAALRPLGLELRGLTVASPHKEAVLRVIHDHSPMVERAGSANLLVRTDGGWLADTTDASGFVALLAEHGIEAVGAEAAIVGCGGSGRAIAVALEEAGSDVVLVNRGTPRADMAHDLLHLPVRPLAEFHANGQAIIVNATPVGKDGLQQPFAIDKLRADAAVFDLPYGKKPTPLVRAARAAGLRAIDGRQMLLAQVPQQFERMVGAPMPHLLARRHLDARDR